MKYLFFSLFFLFLCFFEACTNNAEIVAIDKGETLHIGDDSYAQREDTALGIDSDIVNEQSGSFSELDNSAIYVSVQGCVNEPGIYILPAGSMVFEALNAAGGVSDDADISSVNLVKELTENSTVTILKLEAEPSEWAGNEASVTKDPGKMNINTASKADLKTLPGIGDAKAAAIISYRERNGSFNSVEELMNVSGIKEGVFETIKNDITAY